MAPLLSGESLASPGIRRKTGHGEEIRFTPTISSPKTVIHSIEQDNVGYVYQPRVATFQMQVKAIGSAAAELTQLALAGTQFNIQVAEKKGTDWSFKKLLF